MALLQTPQVESNFNAPDFSLQATNGNVYSLSDIKGEKGFVVMFICNHCPYVKGITDRLASDMRRLQEVGIGVIAISSNDAVDYPEDSFENMALFAKQHGFTFPYCYDENQSVGKTYDAVCTPDFFGFNAQGQLQYRGRLDAAGHQPRGANQTPELVEAMLQIAETGRFDGDYFPSMGCSIKWR